MFGADPAIIGRELKLEERPVTVVGVMRPEFGGLDEYPKDVWLPATANQRTPLKVVARLRRDVNAEQAIAALAGFAATKVEAGKDPRAYRAALEPSATPIPLTFETLAALSPVFVAFGLVLLTACANVSNAMLARAISRQREIAVRLSLGASRWRVVRQLMTEGLLIAVLAGVAALGIASWTLRVGIVLLFETAPPTLASLMRLPPMTFDLRVFLFALAIAAAATLAFALVPALRASRQSLTDALRGQRTGTASGSRLRSALVVAQVAVSMVLIVSALVLARNFTRLAAIDIGFKTGGVYSLNIRGAEDDVSRVAASLAADPRVAEVAATSGNPLFGRGRILPASPDEGRSPVMTRYTFTSPEYFSILQMPIVRGRGFRADEARASAPVAIVSEATARAFWPGVDSIGRTIRVTRPEGSRTDELEGYSQLTVIGTTNDVLSGLIVDGRDTGHIYLPVTARHPRATALLLRPRAASDFRPDVLRPAFRALGEEPEKFEIIALDEMRAIQMYPLRAAAWIGGLLGGIALVLSISACTACCRTCLVRYPRDRNPHGAGRERGLGRSAGGGAVREARGGGRRCRPAARVRGTESPRLDGDADRGVAAERPPVRRRARRCARGHINRRLAAGAPRHARRPRRNARAEA